VGDVWGPFSLSNAMKRSSPAFSKKKRTGLCLTTGKGASIEKKTMRKLKIQVLHKQKCCPIFQLSSSLTLDKCFCRINISAIQMP